MIPEDDNYDSMDNDFGNISLNDSPTPIYKFNLNAKPYEPTTEIESDEKKINKINEKPQTSVPKVGKKVEESEQNRTKVLNEAKEAKETVNIVFIGHVDAGKSTIGGHVLFLTGMVDKRTLEKYEKEAKEKNRESWYFSWALDTNAEERDKGKTVEVGKACFDTINKRFVLLDAPGHRAYVPNMISGVAQADVAVLVISARKGEFETGFDKGGQTREHAQIAKISGVRYLVIAINKMDDPTVNWDEIRYNDIIDRLSVYLKKVGWKSNEMYFIPISGYTGYNLKNPIPPQICPWYQGKPTLLEYLDSLPTINNNVEGSPLVIISDKYKDMGAVCMGKVIAGCFQKGDTFILMPIEKLIKISTILNLDDDEKQVAKIGENVNLRLVGVDEQEIHSGYVLCHPSSLCSVGTIFDAQLVVIECKSIMSAGFKAVIHIHNVVDEVVLVSIRRVMDRKTQEWSKTPARFIKQDSICVVRMSLTRPQCIATFSTVPHLSRFSLRDEGKTVAFGKIIKIVR